MIPATELAKMQAEMALFLPDTCSIITPTHTDDGQGGWTDTFGTVSGVPCRLDYFGRLPQIEALSAGAIQPFGRYMLTIGISGTILPANQIIHNGLTYNVIAVNTDTSWQLCIRAVVEIVR